jgi:osmoprotectant transport system ATP-binding protein
VSDATPPSPDPAIRFENVVRTYGGRRAVDDVTLTVPRGTFAVILGPSGCGKTTLLKTVNRLLDVTEGRIFVDGIDISTVDPTALRRRIGYVIQQVGLFPHMTVAENVATVPGLLGWTSARTAARVEELLDLVHLPPREYRDRYPRQLSGGQQQRVGLARALAADPDILLMDEPFGAVDAIERSHLQDEMKNVHRSLHKTIVFVTHDVDEALGLGELIVVMRDGRIAQAGTPVDVLCHPADAFVATLMDADDALRRLSVVDVATAMDAGDRGVSPSSIAMSATLRDALSKMAGSGDRRLAVLDDDVRVGTLTLDRVLAAARSNDGRKPPR